MKKTEDNKDPKLTTEEDNKVEKTETKDKALSPKAKDAKKRNPLLIPCIALAILLGISCGFIAYRELSPRKDKCEDQIASDAKPDEEKEPEEKPDSEKESNQENSEQKQPKPSESNISSSDSRIKFLPGIKKLIPLNDYQTDDNVKYSLPYPHVDEPSVHVSAIRDYDNPKAVIVTYGKNDYSPFANENSDPNELATKKIIAPEEVTAIAFSTGTDVSHTIVLLMKDGTIAKAHSQEYIYEPLKNGESGPYKIKRVNGVKDVIYIARTHVSDGYDSTDDVIGIRKDGNFYIF